MVIKFLLLGYLILLSGGYALASSISFEVRSYLPPNKELFLSDIAILALDDSYSLEALKAVKVADSAEEVERMSIQDIIRKIKPQLKAIERHCDCKLQIHIPKEILDHSLLGAFTEEKLTARLEHVVKTHCVGCEIEVQNINVLRGVIPESYKRWNALLDARALKGASMVRIFFDDNALNPIVYQMFVRLKKPVLKLRHPLPAGTQPQKEDLDIVLMDVSQERRLLATEQDLPNTELKRSLGLGEVIATNDLILKYKVKIGESIKVIVKNQSLEMEMTGVAQKHGRVGDKIPVRLAKTRKDVYGEVQEDGRVAL